MPEVAIAFLGDVVGAPGRRAVATAVPVLRRDRRCAVVIANGENCRHGSGITPENYRELRRSGVDAVTLGDHCYKERQALPLLADAGEPICRPANLAAAAPGKRSVRLDLPGGGSVHVITVLGRLFMSMPANNPFEAIDREMEGIAARREPGVLVIVEVHAEATSEKQAMAWYCLERWTGGETVRPRVAAVVGTHTHVQTADARLLDQRLATVTDAGMCGPHRSVIGRSIAATIEAMTTQAPTPLDVASDDVRAQGCVIRVDPSEGRATGIEAFDIAAPNG